MPRRPVMPKVLSVREIQIIKLIAADRTTPQIADELKISCRTVEAHRSRGMMKIGCKNVADLIRYALREHLIEA